MNDYSLGRCERQFELLDCEVKNECLIPTVFLQINTINTSDATDKQAPSILIVCKNKLLNKIIRVTVQNEN